MTLPHDAPRCALLDLRRTITRRMPVRLATDATRGCEPNLNGAGWADQATGYRLSFNLSDRQRQAERLSATAAEADQLHLHAPFQV